MFPAGSIAKCGQKNPSLSGAQKNAISEQLFIFCLKCTEIYLAAFVSHSYIHYMTLSGICFVRNNTFEGVFKILSLSFHFLQLSKCRSCTSHQSHRGSYKILTFVLFGMATE